MLPLSFFLPTLPSLHLCPFFGQSHDHLVSPLQITLACLRSSLSYFRPAWFAGIDSPTVLSCDRAVLTQSWEAPIPQLLHREQADCVFSLQTPWVDESPTRVFLSVLLVWLARVFQQHRWGSVGRLILSLWKAKNKAKPMKTALHTLEGHLGRDEIPNVKQLLCKT